jgi:hypothetical protein
VSEITISSTPWSRRWRFFGNVNLFWPHRADHIWPHLGLG